MVNLHAGDPLIQAFHGLFGMGSGDETCFRGGCNTRRYVDDVLVDAGVVRITIQFITPCRPALQVYQFFVRTLAPEAGHEGIQALSRGSTRPGDECQVLRMLSRRCSPRHLLNKQTVRGYGSRDRCVACLPPKPAFPEWFFGPEKLDTWRGISLGAH